MQRSGLNSLGKFFTNGECHRNEKAAPEEKEETLKKENLNKLVLHNRIRQCITTAIMIL